MFRDVRKLRLAVVEQEKRLFKCSAPATRFSAEGIKTLILKKAVN